ncbi:MAG: PAS domain-containing protein [Proteobacteria bacterium]|nr:PAS domain-containing protein [Pseudomonadota bacterium]
MQQYDQLAAARAVELLGFGALNLQLARHWLSLWSEGAPPPRDAIKPRHVKNHLPGIAIIEMRKDGSVTCRLAGSAIAMGLGIDPTGKDVIAITPPEHRAARLQRYRRVLSGAVSRCVKPHMTRFGTVIDVEDIQLPLGGLTEDGARQILYHADWRPQTMDRSMAELVDGMTASIDEMYPITAPVAA